MARSLTVDKNVVQRRKRALHWPITPPSFSKKFIENVTAAHHHTDFIVLMHNTEFLKASGTLDTTIALLDL